MFRIEEKINEVKMRSENDYITYKDKVGKINKEHEDIRDQYNAQMTLINQERLSLREEIHKLYDFMKSIGGSLGKKITVFDYKTESFAPNSDKVEIPPISSPDFKEEYYLLDFILKHAENKKLLEDYEIKVNSKSEEYEKDLKDRKKETQYIKDAVHIAEIYRNIIVIVRDTIKNKIIPEFEYIQAFLYADAIREHVIEYGSLQSVENIEPCSIAEYKCTMQDIHYQFVKNTFDFYEVSTTFFEKTVLTNILADRVVLEEEKLAFNKKIDDINNQIELLLEKKVI